MRAVSALWRTIKIHPRRYENTDSTTNSNGVGCDALFCASSMSVLWGSCENDNPRFYLVGCWVFHRMVLRTGRRGLVFFNR